MFLYSTYLMKLAAISVAAVTMCGSKLIKDWQVHHLLVNIAQLGGNDFNITGTQFPSYENGPSPGRFFSKGEGGGGACQWQFTLPFLCNLYFAVPE